MERVLALRADAFADDVDVSEAMLSWDESRLVAFFESGGEAPDICDAPAAVITPPLPEPVPLSRPLRLLSLHGGGGNKAINMMQMARMKRALDPCTIEYLEGTREWKKESIDPMLLKMFPNTPFWGWYGVENDSGQNHNSGKSYADAMLDPSVTFTYFDYDEALDRLDALIDERERQGNGFDALVGFSQGGIMVTMLTARRLQRATYGEGKLPSWRCNVLLSALPPRATTYAPIYPKQGTPLHTSPPIATFPCVSCIGVKDQYFEYGKRGLRSIYGQLKWFEHAGGHETAKEPELNEAVAEAIWRSAGYVRPSQAA